MQTATMAPRLCGLAEIAMRTGTGLGTLHRVTARLAAAGLIQKVNGSWIASVTDAEVIASTAKALRRELRRELQAAN